MSWKMTVIVALAVAGGLYTVRWSVAQHRVPLVLFAAESTVADLVNERLDVGEHGDGKRLASVAILLINADGQPAPRMEISYSARGARALKFVKTDAGGCAALTPDGDGFRAGQPIKIMIKDEAGVLCHNGMLFAAQDTVVQLQRPRILRARVVGLSDVPGTVRIYQERDGAVATPQFVGSYSVRSNGASEWLGYYTSGDLVCNTRWSGWDVSCRPVVKGSDASVRFDPADVAVRIENSQGQPVAARLDLEIESSAGSGVASIYSDATGVAAFRLPWREFKLLTMFVSADGHYCKLVQSGDSPPSAVRLEVAPGRRDFVTGSVVAEGNHPIEGALVRVMHDGKRELASVATNAKGEFRMAVPHSRNRLHLHVEHKSYLSEKCLVRSSGAVYGMSRACSLVVVPFGLNEGGMYQGSGVQYAAWDVKSGVVHVGHAPGEFAFDGMPRSSYVVFVALPASGIFGVASCDLATADGVEQVRVPCSMDTFLSGSVVGSLAGVGIELASVDLPEPILASWCRTQTSGDGGFRVPAFGLQESAVHVRTAEGQVIEAFLRRDEANVIELPR